MELVNVVPLTEAAAFTVGCAVLRMQWFASERVSMVLVAITALLIIVLLIVLTPTNLDSDTSAFDPAAVLAQTAASSSP